MDTSGKVGIGTDSPGSKLVVYNDSITGNTQLHVHNDKTGDAAVLRLEGKRTSTNDNAQILFANNGSIGSTIRSYSGGDDGDIRFYTSVSSTGNTTSEAMRIDSSGNVSVRSGKSLSIYRDTNAARGQIFMNSNERLYLRNDYANKDMVWDREGQLFINGVRNYYQKLTIINSVSYTFDVPIEATGSGHTVYYECMYNHFGNDTYGTRRMGFFSFRSLNNSTSADHVVHTGGNSTNAGAWSVSMVGAGTSTPKMRFTKSAGSYSGTGQGYIHVRGGLPI
jgi:hypothetical protein